MSHTSIKKNAKRSAVHCSLIPLLAGCSQLAMAAFEPPTEWQRGELGSAYLEWNSFSGSVNTSPDIGAIHIQSATLEEQIGDAFPTSSGNLYSFSSPQSYSLHVSTSSEGPSAIDQEVNVRLQISTWSYEIADREVTLNGQSGNVTLLASGQQTHPIYGSYTQYAYLFDWTVAASGQYQFSWELDESSTSLDAIALDMYADGINNSLVDLPLLPLFPALPNHELFDGSQLYPEDILGPETDPNVVISAAAASPSPVPLPGGLLLFLTSSLTLVIPHLSKRRALGTVR